MGWFLINVALPLGAPLLVIALLKVLPIPSPNKLALNLMTPVKDGQLCWAAIAFSASALYEIDRGVGNLSSVGIGYLQAAAILVISMSSIVAAAGAVFPTSPACPPGENWIRHFSAFVLSLFLAGWAAFVRVVAQFGL